MLPIALLAAVAAAQQAPALGSEVRVRGRTYMPQLFFDLEQRYQADPLLYRRAEHDWRARQLNSGRYPGEAYARGSEGTVGVRLVVDASGRLAGCTVMRPSGEASLDRHVCPHLYRYAAFHPALDRNGRRVAHTFDASVHYQLIPSIQSPLFSPGDGSTPPRPLRAFDAELVGIGATTRRPPHVDSIGAALTVDAEGAVTACTLTQPTFDDALDRRICDGARSVRFQPARDSRGRSVAGDYNFHLRWPRARD